MKMTGSEFQLNRASIGKIVCFLAFFLTFILTTDEISAAPQVLAFNPTSVGQGAVAKTIGVYGSGFQCGMSVSFSDPTIQAIPVKNSSGSPVPYQCGYSTSSGTSFTSIYTNVQFVSTDSTVFTSSNVFMFLNTFSTTSTGTVTATFTNPPPPYGDGTSGTGILTINPAPTLSSVSINLSTVFQGMTITSTLTGTGFQNGGTLSFPGGGVTVNSFNVNGTGTSATASLTISSTIFPSVVPMTLTNPDGGVISVPAAFSVLPALTDRTPALAVYEDGRLVNGRNIPFDIFWNGSWSDEGNILPYSGVYAPKEMTLKAHPFLFQQIAGHPVGSSVEFQIWSKESWGSKLTAVSYPSASKNYDMAFESQTGKGLVVYGKNNGIVYRQIFQDTAGCSPNPFPCWGAENPLITVINSTTPYLYLVKLVSNPDPASNEIMMAYEDSSGRLFIRSWNGGSFSTEVLVSSLLRTTSVPFDMAYMQSSQTGLLAWAETNNGTPKSCTWNRITIACTPTATSPAQTGSTATTSLYTVQVVPDPASDQIALGTIQASGSNNAILKVQIWDGSAWPTNPYPTDVNGVQQLSNVLYFSSSFHWNIFNLIWKNNPRNVLFAIYNNLDPATIDGGLNYQTWDPTAGWNGNQSVPGIPLLASGYLPYFSAIGFDADPRTGDILGGMRTKS
ncbi:MAG: hypothetical protein HYR81_00065, partial [Nitrospirae bacterium]|nr:hypothetical protein [Nitrospirota bacterium]